MKLKTQTVVAAFGHVNSAKLTKLEEKEKYQVIKIARRLKPVATAYEEFRQDAHEKLRPENFDEMQRKIIRWQEEGEKTTLTLDERKEINAFLTDFNRSLEQCLKEESEKEQELDYTPLSEEAFARFLASNDFDVSTAMLLSEVMMGEEQ